MIYDIEAIGNTTTIDIENLLDVLLSPVLWTY